MQWLARFCFMYGCVGAVTMVAWCVRSLSFGITLPAPWIVLGFLAGWGAVMMFTLPHQGLFGVRGLVSGDLGALPIDPLRFNPVLTVTPGRIRFARWVLLGLAANALWWLVLFFAFNTPETVGRNLTMNLSSLAVLSLVYFSAHWGFRPQHLFAHTRLEWVLGRDWRGRMAERESLARKEELRQEAARLAKIVGRKVAEEKLYGRQTRGRSKDRPLH